MADDQEFPREVVEAVALAFTRRVQSGSSPLDGFRDALRTLTALGYRRVGADEVVVPREPTEAMLDAGGFHVFRPGHTWNDCAAGVYRAMLAAARSSSGGGM